MMRVAAWVLKGHPGSPGLVIRLVSAASAYRLTKRLIEEGRL